MLLYDVRLESQTDSQWRQMTVGVPAVVPTAAREAYAKALCVRREQELVNFSLTPKSKTEPPAPPLSDDVNVQVAYLNALESYDKRADANVGSDLPSLAVLEAEHGINASGKTYGPTKIGRAHIHAHRQALPYVVTSVKPNIPSVSELVRAAVALNQHEGAWERALSEMRAAGLKVNAVTASLFGLTAQVMIDGSAPIVWSSATMDVALTTSTYTPNQDTHDFFNDVTNEITGTGYSAGGATLGSKTSTYDTASDQIRLDAADTTWTTSTLTARRAVLYKSTGTGSTSPVVGWVDFGADVSTTAGTFQITWDATGIVVYDVT